MVFFFEPKCSNNDAEDELVYCYFVASNISQVNDVVHGPTVKMC